MPVCVVGFLPVVPPSSWLGTVSVNVFCFLFKSIEVGVKFYMVWNLRCLKLYYKEV